MSRTGEPAPSPRRLRFYCPLRESTHKGADHYGPEVQLQDCCRFAQQWAGGGHDVSPDFAPIVVESATEGDRERWEAVVERGIALVREGVRDAFLFPRVDRESRNPFLSIPILKRVLDAGIPVFFARQRIQLSPRDPQSVSTYLDEVRKAVDYVEVLVRNTSEGRRRRAEGGQHPTNTVMFGFCLIAGQRVPEPAEASAIREAAQVLLRQGVGAADRWLNDQGWRSRKGKPFSRQGLVGKSGGLFRNPALIGETTIQFKDGPVTIAHEGILDRAVFQAVQESLERRIRAPRLGVYHLAGLGRCRCGAKVVTNTSSVPRRYYQCTRHCGERGWRKEKLEWMVWRGLADWMKDRELRLAELRLAGQAETDIRQRLLRVRVELERVEAQWASLLHQHLEGQLSGYPPETVEAVRRDLWARLNSLKGEKVRLEEDLKALPGVSPEELAQALDWLGRPWQAWLEPTLSQGALTLEAGKALREAMLKLGAGFTLDRGQVVVEGRLPVGRGIKEGSS